MSRRKEIIQISVVIIIALLLLSAPFFIRSLRGNYSLLGQESYVHVATAKNMLVSDSVPISQNSHSLFDVFLAAMYKLFSFDNLWKIIPMAFGLISAVLLFFLSKWSSEDKESALITSIIAVTSPLYLFLFGTVTSGSIMLVMSLLALLSMKKFPWISYGLLVLSAGINVFGFICLGLLLLAQSFPLKQWRKTLIIFGSSIFLVTAVYIFTGIIAMQPSLVQSGLNKTISSFGAATGFSIFSLILAGIGAHSSWSRNKEQVLGSVVLIIAFLFSFQSVVARAVFAPVLFILAGRGFLFLAKRKWSVSILKEATLFIIILSILFTSMMTLSSQVQSSPSSDHIEAMKFLRTSPVDDVILSSVENGVFIENFAKREAFLDAVMSEEEHSERLEIANEIFSSRRLNDVAGTLRSNNITHILVDSDMRNGGVWRHEEDGFLFLLENSPRFIIIYKTEEVTVYRYIAP